MLQREVKRRCKASTVWCNAAGGGQVPGNRRSLDAERRLQHIRPPEKAVPGRVCHVQLGSCSPGTGEPRALQFLYTTSQLVTFSSLLSTLCTVKHPWQLCLVRISIMYGDAMTCDAFGALCRCCPDSGCCLRTGSPCSSLKTRRCWPTSLPGARCLSLMRSGTTSSRYSSPSLTLLHLSCRCCTA